MKVKEIMTRDVEIANPDDTLETAAKTMCDIDAGVLPVGENDRLVGVVTDRDIVVRGVAEALDPKTATLRDVMTDAIRYCFEDDEIEAVAAKMSEWQVRRIPILNREKRLVGIVSLGDIAAHSPEKEHAKSALEGVSRSTAEHAYAGSKPGAAATRRQDSTKIG